MTRILSNIFLLFLGLAVLGACSDGDRSRHAVDLTTDQSQQEQARLASYQSLLVDAAWDMFDVLVYTTRLAREESEQAQTDQELRQYRHFADRVSNTRHEFDRDVTNALRAGVSPQIALRLLRDQDANFEEIADLAARLPYMSTWLEDALVDVFETRDRLIRMLSTNELIFLSLAP